MDQLFFYLPGNEELGEKLLDQTGFPPGDAAFRHFPDGESYVRILSDVRDKKVTLLCSLARPDDKLMMIYFFSEQARHLGARSIRLLAPYLGYMRQDKAFHPGEAVTSELFGRLLSSWVDELITINPHLHRHHELSEIYTVPTTVLHAEPLIVDYIRNHISRPVLIGPDEESKQWVAGIAARAGCEYLVLKKERLGDREVRVTVPGAPGYRKHTPVLVDDIISTGRTMLVTAGHLREQGVRRPVCIGIHGVFAGDAWRDLQQAGIETIVTSNTIPHPTNGLDVSGLLAGQLLKDT